MQLTGSKKFIFFTPLLPNDLLLNSNVLWPYDTAATFNFAIVWKRLLFRTKETRNTKPNSSIFMRKKLDISIKHIH